jgi:hypothetical protein
VTALCACRFLLREHLTQRCGERVLLTTTAVLYQRRPVHESAIRPVKILGP